MPIEITTRRTNGHDSHEPDTCPYCGAPATAASRARIAKVESDLQERVAREMAKAEVQANAAIEKAKKEAENSAARKVEALVAARLEALRETHEKAVNAAILGERAKHIGEKLALEGQVDEMKRRLQARTAHQLGEPAEIELATALETAFPGDNVWRVVKGQKGPDVVVEIAHEGAVAGKIVLDSKNHARWSNRFTSKLRSDMLAEKADFGVLVSSTFPSGTRELHMQDGVLVVSPARVVVVVHFLRQQVISNYRLRLSAEARDEKGDRLLAYLTSAAASDRFGALGKATDDMIDLEAREIDIQTGIHRKRGEMIRAVQRAHEELTASIEGILTGNEPVDLEAAI